MLTQQGSGWALGLSHPLCHIGWEQQGWFRPKALATIKFAGGSRSLGASQAFDTGICKVTAVIRHRTPLFVESQQCELCETMAGVGETKQWCASLGNTGKYREFKKWKFNSFHRHVLLTSFDIFVVTYRVTNFLPKLLDMLLKKMNFHFLFSPIFGFLPKSQSKQEILCNRLKLLFFSWALWDESWPLQRKWTTTFPSFDQSELFVWFSLTIDRSRERQRQRKFSFSRLLAVSILFPFLCEWCVELVTEPGTHSWWFLLTSFGKFFFPCLVAFHIKCLIWNSGFVKCRDVQNLRQ